MIALADSISGNKGFGIRELMIPETDPLSVSIISRYEKVIHPTLYFDTLYTKAHKKSVLLSLQPDSYHFITI